MTGMCSAITDVLMTRPIPTNGYSHPQSTSVPILNPGTLSPRVFFEQCGSQGFFNLKG